MRCKTILIVEDDALIRETLQTLLEMEGYAVFAAENGKEGLAVLHQIESPCLILLDLLMPVMDGMEFLATKNKDDFIASIPVCVVSGVLERPQTRGLVGYFKKPINFDSLLDFIKKYCGNS